MPRQMPELRPNRSCPLVLCIELRPRKYMFPSGICPRQAGGCTCRLRGPGSPQRRERVPRNRASGQAEPPHSARQVPGPRASQRRSPVPRSAANIHPGEDQHRASFWKTASWERSFPRESTWEDSGGSGGSSPAALHTETLHEGEAAGSRAWIRVVHTGQRRLMPGHKGLGKAPFQKGQELGHLAPRDSQEPQPGSIFLQGWDPGGGGRSSPPLPPGGLHPPPVGASLPAVLGPCFRPG